MIVNMPAPVSKRDVETPRWSVASSRVGIAENDVPALTNPQESGVHERVRASVEGSVARDLRLRRTSSDGSTGWQPPLRVEAAFYAGLAISQECGPALRTSSETWDSNFRKFSRKRSASFLACSS